MPCLLFIVSILGRLPEKHVAPPGPSKSVTFQNPKRFLLIIPLIYPYSVFSFTCMNGVCWCVAPDSKDGKSQIKEPMLYIIIFVCASTNTTPHILPRDVYLVFCLIFFLKVYEELYILNEHRIRETAQPCLVALFFFNSPLYTTNMPRTRSLAARHDIPSR